VTEATKTKEVVKVGTGIELTFETLVEVLRQRFPNALDWEQTYHITPHLDYSVQTEVVGFYFTGFRPSGNESPDEVRSEDSPLPYAKDVALPIRRVGQGAPIPVLHMRLDNVLLEDERPRCGYFFPLRLLPSVTYVGPQPEQCVKPVGHEGDHTNA
jgi:hypothetical protein